MLSALRLGGFQILDPVLEYLNIILCAAKDMIAVATEKATNPSGVVVVINVKTVGFSASFHFIYFFLSLLPTFP